MKSPSLLLLGLTLATTASAESLERPAMKAGDTWVYRETREKGPSGWNQTREELTITRVTGSTIYLAVRPSGSTQPPKEIFVGSDWSRSRDVNGKDTVVGYETVEVPAGKFRALKVESEGRWEAEVAPGQSVVQGAQSGQGGATLVTQVQNTTERETSGRTYKAFWYVPEVKRWVKSVEEYYSSGGVRNERYTQELESYKFADAVAQ